MQKRVMDTPNIDVLFETQTIGLFGENSLEGAHLVKAKDTDREEYMDIAIDGFFLAIGHKPNTDIFLPALHVDENGYIKTIQLQRIFQEYLQPEMWLILVTGKLLQPQLLVVRLQSMLKNI